MTTPAYRWTPAVYTCEVCGGCDVWGPTWSWYGSYKDLDNFGPDSVPKFCSDKCADKWADKHAAAIVADGARTEAAMSRSWTLTIPAPARWLNSNDRGNRKLDNPAVQEWKRAAAIWARKAKMPKLGAIHVEATLHFCDRRLRDAPNYYPTIKAAIDGLVLGEVLDDDDNLHVLSLLIRPGAPMPKPKYGPAGQMVLTIREAAL